MIAFCGYDFCSDGNSLSPCPTIVEKMSSAKIGEATFDDLYITQDITSFFTTDKPTEWDLFTIIQANFDNNLNGGNLEFELSKISGIRIKRRKLTDTSWITLYDKQIETIEDLTFAFNDFTALYNTEYEYAWVPVLNDAEGEYVTAQTLSTFNGVFVADVDSIYKFYAGVEYSQSQQVQKIGTFEPFGRKYPVYVTNALTNYQTGGIVGKIMADYEETRVLDRQKMVSEKNNLLQFLTNKKAKFIKDWNGNSFLVIIVSNPSVTYDSNWGNGMMNVGFNWSEVGDSESGEDLYSVGLVPQQQTT